MKSLKIVNTYNTLEGYLNSPELKALYQGFQVHLPANERVQRKLASSFKKAFVVETNPEENYGRSFAIYILRNWNDGRRTLKEQTIGASLNNQNIFPIGFVKDGQIQILSIKGYMRNPNQLTKEMLSLGGFLVC